MLSEMTVVGMQSFASPSMRSIATTDERSFIDALRRLAENGVRFIQIYSGGGHQQENWDAHNGVEENLNIHCRKSLTDVFGVEVGNEFWGRFTAHFTPPHGSCLDQAEIEIGIFSRQCLGNRVVFR